MKKGMVVLCAFLCAFMLAMVGCPKYEKVNVGRNTKTFIFQGEETYKTLGPVTKLDGFVGAGKVIIKRTDNGRLLPAIVIPLRKIPPGQEVKVLEFCFMRKDFHHIQCLLIVE